MSNIKERKQMLVIELKDGTILHSDKTLIELQQGLSGKSDFVLIDGILFNKFEFKKAQEKKVDSVQQFILSLSDQDKATIKKRETTMTELGKTRENIEQVQRYLESKK